MAEIRAITFDVYGTLVDWEAGIRSWAEKMLAKKGSSLTGAEFFQKWEEHQFSLLTPYRGYRDLTARAVERVLRDLKLPVDPDDGPSLADQISKWKPFPDVGEALRRLGAQYKLGVISNMDNIVLFETVSRLGAPVHFRFSAEDARAYKPDPAPFKLMLQRTGMDPAHVLHAGFGWRYDLTPAHELGMQTAFVNRGGIELPSGAHADLVVPSVAALADKLLAA
jgi:2-haloalkanoic acid dehalogenase type II